MTNQLPIAVSVICVAGILGEPVTAGIVAKITADNHYAIYTESDGVLSYVGGNETGPGGSPGTYNWSKAETWPIGSADSIYIAAWSDRAVAQGLLAQIMVGGEKHLTGQPGWSVYATGLEHSTNDPHPPTGEVAAQIALADADNLWEDPYVGPENRQSAEPWKKINGISRHARWIWSAPDGVDDPLRGGADHGEYLIFRTPTAVPAPSVALVLLAGVIAGPRRRRHDAGASSRVRGER